MPDERRPTQPRVIDPEDEDQIRECAAELDVKPEFVAEAVEKVGGNRTAVELYLSAPTA